VENIKAKIKKRAAEHKCRDGNLLLEWFHLLNPEERGRVLSFEDKEGALLIRRMYKTKKKEGDMLFFSVQDPVLLSLEQKHSQSSTSEDSVFCFKKIIHLQNICFYSERLLDSDNLLEESIRLCDTREYLDTMTLSSNLLEDVDEFLQLMWVATRGGFLSNPCKGKRRYSINSQLYTISELELCYKDLDLGRFEMVSRYGILFPGYIHCT
jgi:hypothetical protein